MSNKVKDRLQKLALQMTHEERIMLDEALDQLAMRMGYIIVKGEKGCDKVIDQIPDEKFIEIVSRIKKKKRKQLIAT